jgi:tetratricopeptide (TPR) repeat protein
MRSFFTALSRFFRRPEQSKAASGATDEERQVQMIETVARLSTLGDELAASGKHLEAQAAYDQCLTLAEKHLSDQPVLIKGLLSSFSSNAFQRGDYASASSYDQRLLAFVKATEGEASREYAVGLGNVAETYLRQNLLDEAKLAAAMSMNLIMQQPNLNQHDLAYAIGQLGVIQKMQGDYDAAIANIEQALAFYQTINDVDTPELGRLLTALGDSYFQSWNFPSARSAFEKSLAFSLSTCGPHSNGVIDARYMLALVMRKLNDPVKAEQLLRENIAALTIMEGPGHPLNIKAMSVIGGLYIETNQGEAAVNTLTEALKLAEHYLDTDHLLKSEISEFLAQAQLLSQQ